MTLDETMVALWWESWPTLFAFACMCAATAPDDISRMRMRKEWSAEFGHLPPL